ncbi:MAG: class I SAM-dependent methyltransferase [Candidimonas sp.]|nr:MAG: class I SAM-dependent methyltransferase [Candidimonas sp.]TAM21284.1 MAG: class I SAM-dependent methyltransferase [Candidimonas sp.]
MSEILGTAGYGANAIALADQYESVKFADVHRDVLHLFPLRACGVLDIGAGSGRDAALARQGHHVIAVEPTAELRTEGMRRHAALPINWVDDHLPVLHRIRMRGVRYDLILLTAVWMHLDATERELAMEVVAELLADNGQVIMSLRHGSVPEGRTMFDVSVEETMRLAEVNKLRASFLRKREDMLGRNDVTWRFLVFQHELQ